MEVQQIHAEIMNDCLPPSNEDRMDEHGLLTTFQNVRVSLFCTLKKEHLEQRRLSSTCPSLYYMESAPKENFLKDEYSLKLHGCMT